MLVQSVKATEKKLVRQTWNTFAKITGIPLTDFTGSTRTPGNLVVKATGTWYDENGDLIFAGSSGVVLNSRAIEWFWGTVDGQNTRMRPDDFEGLEIPATDDDNWVEFHIVMGGAS